MKARVVFAACFKITSFLALGTPIRLSLALRTFALIFKVFSILVLLIQMVKSQGRYARRTPVVFVSETRAGCEWLAAPTTQQRLLAQALILLTSEPAK